MAVKRVQYNVVSLQNDKPNSGAVLITWLDLHVLLARAHFEKKKTALRKLQAVGNEHLANLPDLINLFHHRTLCQNATDLQKYISKATCLQLSTGVNLLLYMKPSCVPNHKKHRLKIYHYTSNPSRCK